MDRKLGEYNPNMQINQNQQRPKPNQRYQNSQNLQRPQPNQRQAQRRQNIINEQRAISRSERQRKRLKHSKTRRISGRIGFVFLTFIAAFLALTIFFRVDEIKVESTAHYTAAELKNDLGIEKGDNMFTFRASSLEKKMLESHPYLASVRIDRELPSTIIVTVEDSVPAFAVPLSSGGYFLADENGKMLEKTSIIPDDVPSVTGITINNGTEGEYLDTNGNENIKALIEVAKALKEFEIIRNVDFINVSALADIRIGYLGRLDIRLGDKTKLGEKLQMMLHIVQEELSPSDVQIIHLEDPTTVYCPPTTKEKINQSALPLASNMSAYLMKR